ncbi:MAG: polyribonucleotide nucleotidyltransferase [Patescibacteria group bacterium]
MKLNKKEFKLEFQGKDLSMEVSQIGEQANAAIIGRYGGTVVLATVVMGKEDRGDKDYLPLMVDYEEKFYAVGKILGSQYMRREGKSSEHAVLSGRLIDRTIRPLFNHGMRRDIQVVVTILSLDPKFDPHFIGLLTASTAIAISDVPWDGPVAALTIAKMTNNELVINPSSAEGFSAQSGQASGLEFDLLVSGTADKINMIEFEGIDAQEKEVVEALEIGQKEITKLIKFQNEIVKEIGQKKAEVTIAEPDEKLKKAVKNFISDKLEKTIYTKTKMVRVDNFYNLQKELEKKLIADGFGEDDLGATAKILEEEVDATVHKNILESEKRPDFRKLNEVRDLGAEVGLLERVHGSALFMRGNTQALALTTLGPPDDEQSIESMEFSGKKRFILHYNFPPFATGETGSFRGPGRREIGHGALAEKALRNLIPSKNEFPYTIRIVSEILSSNGSSSMASVCAGCLSLMDAGVPIKKMAAGIAMGLIMDPNGEKYKVLTDIQGPEDHYGDMDFKAAGTKDGVTAIQMDVKIQGVTAKMIGDVLAQAKEARLHILKAMEQALDKPRAQVSAYAPIVYSIDINPAKIGEVIGPGGKVINGIIAQTKATGIDIDQSGKVYVYGSTIESAQAALKQVEAITHEYKIGEMVEGRIVKVLDFGAILEFGPGMDGMIHVSELKNGFVKKVEDVVKVGDFVRAKIIRMEDGRIGLSLKNL